MSFTDSLTPEGWALTIVIGVLCALLLFWLALRTPLRWLLAGCLAISMLQIYGPLGFMSLSMFALAGLLPGVIIRTRRHGLSAWAILLAGLAGWQTLSAAWSATVGSAAYGVLTSCALLTCYLVSRAMLRETGSNDLAFALLAASPLVGLEALLVICFRIWPAVEEMYLRSQAALMLSEPGVDVLYAGGYDNVLDPDKSGGLLLNGNTASLLLALCACCYAMLAVWGRAIWFSVGMTSVCGIAMFATGSKSPLVLAVLLPAVMLVTMVTIRWPRRGVAVLISTVAAAVALFALVQAVMPSLLAESSRTFGERLTLWQLVLSNVPDHWFFGMGFGNWREFMVERVNSNPDMAGDPTLRVLPPHNLLAQAWVDAGLVSVALTLALILLPLISVARSLWEGRAAPLTSRVALTPAIAGTGLLWVTAHGMTDTTTFSGDNHTIPWLGILVALALSSARIDARTSGSKGANRTLLSRARED